MKKNLSFLLLIFLYGAAAIAAQTKTPKFSSVYTDLNKDCKGAFSPKERRQAESRGQDEPLKCKGFGGYFVYIYFSAQSSIIQIDNSRDDSFINIASQSLNYDAEKGGKIEWRLADGKPFAVIARVSNYKSPDELSIDATPFDPKYKIGESLIVKGLKKFERIDAEIDAKTPSANEKVRQTADQDFLKK